MISVAKIFNMDEIFWNIKYEHDFISLKNILQAVKLDSWKKLYIHANLVSNNYPQLSYPLTEYEIHNTCLGTQYEPIFESRKEEDFVVDLIETIKADNWGIVMIKNKIIPLTNFYVARTKEQKDYENNIRKYIINNMVSIIQLLEIGDSLIIYNYNFTPVGEILTKTKDCYKLEWFKERNVMI